MSGNQWQYIIVFLLLIGITGWVCYNLFSRKRRKSIPQCLGCSMKEICHDKNREGKTTADSLKCYDTSECSCDQNHDNTD